MLKYISLLHRVTAQSVILEFGSTGFAIDAMKYIKRVKCIIGVEQTLSQYERLLKVWVAHSKSPYNIMTLGRAKKIIMTDHYFGEFMNPCTHIIAIYASAGFLDRCARSSSVKLIVSCKPPIAENWNYMKSKEGWYFWTRRGHISRSPVNKKLVTAITEVTHQPISLRINDLKHLLRCHPAHCLFDGHHKINHTAWRDI